MLKAECDECHRPIDPKDNHLAFPDMHMVDSGRLMRAQNAHFCGKSCLCKFIDKATSRIIPPPPVVNGN